MPKTRSYVEKLTKHDEGRRVEDPSGEEWTIQGVAKRTERGRGAWYVGLKHTEERGRYREEKRDTILHNAWTWGDDGRAPDVLPGGSSTKKAPRDDDGRRLCHRCGAPIFFIEMPTGKKMPVDNEPIAARDVLEEIGEVMMDRPTGWVTRNGKVLTTHELKQAAEANLTIYRSHFASCDSD